MLISYWIKGIIIGILATAPIGPISILVIQRTLNNNRRVGFYSGAGVALSDTLYAAFTGFGMALVLGLIQTHELWFRIGGAIVLFSLGIVIFLSHPERIQIKRLEKPTLPFKHLATTFAFAISNPYVMFYFLAIFSGFGVALTVKEPLMAVFVLLGFIIGDLLWWFGLTWIIDRFRKRFSLKFLRWYNRLAGAGIILFVLVFLVQTIVEHK